MVGERMPGNGGQYRRQHPAAVVARYRFNPGAGRMHDSLTDVRATLHVPNSFLDDPEATDAVLGQEMVCLFREPDEGALMRPGNLL